MSPRRPAEMDAYQGFEPQVGEIRALRTFRVGPGGVLYPLFNDSPWVDGTNTAHCPAHHEHIAPDGDCTCGFYAYASEAAAREHPHSRHVLAVVACWGRVIAGTRGLRAQHARIEALWMSAAVPPDLAGQVETSYPSTSTYPDKSAMLSEHPPTALDCYEQGAGRSLTTGLRVAIAVAVVIGSLPANWIWSNQDARTVWAVEVGFFLTAALVLVLTRRDVRSRGAALSFVALSLWLAAPFAGVAGTYLLRLPMLQIAFLGFVHRVQLRRSANTFPAKIGEPSQSRRP